MAQWLGQFSGHTHATKLEDAETALRHAVAVFRAAGPDDHGRKSKAVRNLAERLLAARLKLLKARLAALEPVAEGREQNADPWHLRGLLGIGDERCPAEEDERDAKPNRVVPHDGLLLSALCMPCTWGVQRTGIMTSTRCFTGG